MNIVFQNKGVINLDAITTFGVSSKETKNPIGFFGTGLKYAISIILRHGGKITIFAGEKQLNFSVQKTTVRVNDFNIIKMNSRKLGFTTELGKTWELWQAFRELYCNTLDEGGLVYQDNQLPENLKGNTTIMVNCPGFDDLFYNRHKIVLESKPVFKNNVIEIHPGETNSIYYRGIPVHRLNKPTKVTYNILSSLDLTEDRTVKYFWEATGTIFSQIAKLTDVELIKTIFTASSNYFENSIDFSDYKPCEVFISTARDLVKNSSGHYNISLAVLLKKLDRNAELFKPLVLNKIQKESLDKAISFCKALGYTVEDYEIKTVMTLGEETLGLAKDDVIYLSERCFMLGTKMLAGTLIEEYLHLKYNVMDFDRKLQNILFDTVVSFGEQILNRSL